MRSTPERTPPPRRGRGREKGSYLPYIPVDRGKANRWSAFPYFVPLVLAWLVAAVPMHAPSPTTPDSKGLLPSA